MKDEITDVKSSDIEFLEELRIGPNSSVFKAKVRGQLCAMKIHHGRKIPQHAEPGWEWDNFTREVTAYRLLKAKGLCARGVVPDFFGAITNIQPAEWPDELDRFRKDELPANAILLEYIPNLKRIDLDNFSEPHLAKLHEILAEIHALGILHDDPFPRNMVIAKGEGPGQENDRVLWIDFDSCETVTPDRMDDRLRHLFQEEVQIVQEFTEALRQDYNDGGLKKAWRYYYACE